MPENLRGLPLIYTVDAIVESRGFAMAVISWLLAFLVGVFS